jgi:hypothetical protein
MKSCRRFSRKEWGDEPAAYSIIGEIIKGAAYSSGVDVEEYAGKP